MNAQNNVTYNCLDITKFLFAICVIAIHTQLPLPAPLAKLRPLADPIFFTISGFLLFVKTTPLPTSQESNILKKYCKKMIKIYLAWNIVYLPLAIYEYVMWDTGIIKGIIFFIKDLFLRGGHYYSGHFWFILSCIYGIVFIHFLRKKQFSAEKILVFGFVALLTLCIIDEYIVKGTFQVPLLISFQQLIALTIGSGQLLAGFYYLALSMAVTKYNEKIPSSLIWAICAAAFLIYAFSNCNLFINELCLSITAICLTVGLSRITLTNHKIYIWLRRTSLVMYYSHNLFIFLWLDVFNPNHTHTTGNICFLLTFICTFILGCIVNLIREKADKNNPAVKLLQLLSL